MDSQPPRHPSNGLLKQFRALPGGGRVLTSGLSLAGLLFGAVLVNTYIGVRSYRDLNKKLERQEAQMERSYRDLNKKLERQEAQMERSYRDLNKKLERQEARMERQEAQIEQYHRENQQDRKDSEARLERLIHMMFSKQAHEEQKGGKN